MGYWVNTAYVNHSSVTAVSNQLSALLLNEGMLQIEPPPARKTLLVEPMQYDAALNNDLWGVAVFPGAESWTVIQTAPLELLAEQSPVTGSPRLAELCSALSVSAFHFNVYDGSSVVLLEVSDAGDFVLSGLNMASDAEDPFEWNGQRLSEEFIEAQFQLHPYPDLLAGAALGDDQAALIRQRFGGDNASYCNNLVSVVTLIGYQPFLAPGGLALYYRWSGASRQRFAAAASWDDYKKAVG